MELLTGCSTKGTYNVKTSVCMRKKRKGLTRDNTKKHVKLKIIWGVTVKWHTKPGGSKMAQVVLDSKKCRGQSSHQGSTRGAKDGTMLFMGSILMTEPFRPLC